jgi:hypothetical protein
VAVAASVRIVLAALAAIAVSGCASVQVRSVATDTGQPAFDLVGPNLPALARQAAQLCPQGHAVLRQAQRSNLPAGDGDVATDWLLATGVFSYDLQPAQAQMSIACRA